MIRVLVLMIGLGLGLAVALVFEGRMAHLRLLAGDRLPVWTEQIAAGAGLLQGQAGPFATLPDAHLHWHFSRFTREGPVWRMALAARGMGVSGDLHPGRGAPMHVSGLQGRVEVGALAIWAQPPGIEARMQITRGEARFDPGTGTLRVLDAEGLITDVVLEQSAFGEGRFSAALESDGRLRIGVNFPANGAELEFSSDTTGADLRLRVPAQEMALLPPVWGAPRPSGDGMFAVSHLLLLRQQTVQ